MKNYLTTKRIALIAIMSAIAGLLMIVDFPVSFIAPSFYKMDISDLPCLIGSFALGPLAGTLIELLKVLIKLILKPTSTAFVGELSNFLCGVAMCVPSGFIYLKEHNKKGAIKALIIGSLSMVVLSSIINYALIIPTYVKLYGMPLDAIISAGKAIFPIVKDKFTFVLICVTPFNLVKAIIVSVITYFLYKRISNLLK